MHSRGTEQDVSHAFSRQRAHTVHTNIHVYVHTYVVCVYLNYNKHRLKQSKKILNGQLTDNSVSSWGRERDLKATVAYEIKQQVLKTRLFQKQPLVAASRYHILSQEMVLIGFWEAFLRRSHHCGHDGVVERRLFLRGLLQDLNQSVSMRRRRLRGVT